MTYVVTRPDMQLLVSEACGTYRAAQDAEILRMAELILLSAIYERDCLDTPQLVCNHLRVWIGNLPHEVFAVLFLDAQHRLIEHEIMFRGTLTQTSVYPREILKRCMELNAASVILAHNHPSGVTTPSKADENLTQGLKAALALVDVRVLDHIIVAPCGSTSMAQMGLM